MYLMLIYTPLLAIVFLGERLHLYHVIGSLFIVGGIYLSVIGERLKRRSPNH
jgi:drug/metabolite transporter (DMT)-like permease